jgi:hypothetical protein
LARQLEEKKRAGERLVLPPPEQPALAAFYANLTKVAASIPVMKVLSIILQRFVCRMLIEFLRFLPYFPVCRHLFKIRNPLLLYREFFKCR